MPLGYARNQYARGRSRRVPRGRGRGAGWRRLEGPTARRAGACRRRDDGGSLVRLREPARHGRTALDGPDRRVEGAGRALPARRVQRAPPSVSPRLPGLDRRLRRRRRDRRTCRRDAGAGPKRPPRGGHRGGLARSRHRRRRVVGLRRYRRRVAASVDRGRWRRDPRVGAPDRRCGATCSGAHRAVALARSVPLDGGGRSPGHLHRRARRGGDRRLREPADRGADRLHARGVAGGPRACGRGSCIPTTVLARSRRTCATTRPASRSSWSTGCCIATATSCGCTIEARVVRDERGKIVARTA